MYRHCTTEDTVRRQRQLERCLLQAMEKKQYHDISVRELCQAAGISRMAFYQYFDTKDDALLALIDHTLQDFGSFDCAYSELERFAVYWQLNKSLLDVLHANQMDNFLTDRALRLVLDEDYDFRSRLRADHDDCGELILRFTVQGIISVVQTWHQSQYRQSTSQIASLLHRILLQPLMTLPAAANK